MACDVFNDNNVKNYLQNCSVTIVCTIASATRSCTASTTAIREMGFQNEVTSRDPSLP